MTTYWIKAYDDGGRAENDGLTPEMAITAAEAQRRKIGDVGTKKFIKVAALEMFGTEPERWDVGNETT